MYRTATQTNNTKSQAQLELIQEQQQKAEAQLLTHIHTQEQALLLGRTNRDLNPNQFTSDGPDVSPQLNRLSQAAPVMHQVNPTSRQEAPVLNDALDYLDRVRYTYPDRPDKYNRLIETMTDFKADTIDESELVSRLTNLFYDAPALLAGFNMSLSPGWKAGCGIEGNSGTARAVSPARTITTVPPSNHHGITHLPQSPSYSTESVSQASLFGASEAPSGNINRGPVEYNQCITYANRVKLSLTAVFSFMNHSFRKRQLYVLHSLN